MSTSVYIGGKKDSRKFPYPDVYVRPRAPYGPAVRTYIYIRGPPVDLVNKHAGKERVKAILLI